MPYSSDDAQRFTRKADTSKKRRQWRHVFDDATKRGESEGSAIRQANGVVKRSSEERLTPRRRGLRRGRIRH